jgi:hypothetical protein
MFMLLANSTSQDGKQLVNICDIGRGYIIKHFGRTMQTVTVVCSKKYKPVKIFPILPAYTLILKIDSVETTNEMQPCNRIYYSTVN